jgi:hypothetical protein
MRPAFFRALTKPQQRRTDMKIYSVLYAEDVPHYGTAEIEAETDTEAIAKAKAGPFETDDPDWNNTVCRRIVHIEGPAGIIAEDVPLDPCTLIYGEDKRQLSESAPELALALGQAIDALEHIAEITHYENGEPVTGLEPHEIAAIYADAAGQLEDFKSILNAARGQQ